MWQPMVKNSSGNSTGVALNFLMASRPSMVICGWRSVWRSACVCVFVCVCLHVCAAGASDVGASGWKGGWQRAVAGRVGVLAHTYLYGARVDGGRMTSGRGWHAGPPCTHLHDVEADHDLVVHLQRQVG